MGEVGSPAPLLSGGLVIRLGDEVPEQVPGENEQEDVTHAEPSLGR
jgi:hypothetical protein